MKIRFLTIISTMLIATLLIANSIIADEHEETAECTNFTEALTVFQDVSAMNRRKGAGKNLTELHQKHEAQGWTFEDLEIYIENGDLEGFFVTYSRTYCQ